jgi:hypothetical protein
MRNMDGDVEVATSMPLPNVEPSNPVVVPGFVYSFSNY